MTKDGRIRLFEIVQFEEFWKPTKALNWLDKIACDFLAVYHDKDKNADGTMKKKHFHIVVRLRDARKLDDIAKNCEVGKQYIEIKNDFKSACAYLFHLTSNAKKDGKYQYDGNVVIGSKHITYEDVYKNSIAYATEQRRSDAVKELLYSYGNCEITRSEVLKRIGPKDYDKYGNLFKKMTDYRIMKVRDRDMKVIYITGASGSGKTTLAKYMARISNYDFFVSGTGADVLDGYDKEEAIILDDLRGDVFKKYELFKLTDNNTNSSVKSRFKNKDISYCKLMIITSVKSPQNLYKWDEFEDGEDKEETFSQFARRIGNGYVEIKEDGTILQCSYDLDYKRVSKRVREDVNMSDVFALLGFEKKVGSDVIDILFSAVKKNIDENKKKYELKDEELPF